MARLARIARKSDGRRIFTDKFKRTQIERVARGELTLGELSRSQGIARSLLHRWRRSLMAASEPPATMLGRTSPVHGLGPTQYIRELQRLLGEQTIELALLRTQLLTLRPGRRAARAFGG